MRIISIISIVFIVLASIANAGGNPNLPNHPEENVLRPLLINTYLGPMAGLNINFHLGDFVTNCDCVYSGGSGIGPVGGVFLEYPISKYWSVYGGVAYQDTRAKFTRTNERLEYVQSGEFVNVQFEQTADVTLAYLGLQARAKWRTGIQTLYLSFGPTIESLISNHIKETEVIKTPGFVYTSNRTRQNLYMDEALPARRNIRFAAVAAIGYDIIINPRFIVMPEMSFQLPLSSVTTSDSDWKATSLQFSVFIKFGI